MQVKWKHKPHAIILSYLLPTYILVINYKHGRHEHTGACLRRVYFFNASTGKQCKVG